jgi:hypothetical protein
MKKKTLSKKLVFNKKTVVNLNQDDMGHVKGGETGITCYYCDSDVSCIVTHCDWDESVYTGCYCTDFSCGYQQCDFGTHNTNCCPETDYC